MMKKMVFISALIALFSLGSFAQNANESQEDPDVVYAKDLLKSGEQAPNFVLKDWKGEQHELYQMAPSYKVIEFWASWCPDCRRDLPKVNALAEKSQTSKLPVAFIGISYDTNKEAWMKCINETYKMRNILELSELKKWKETQTSKDYHINWIPSYYILDQQNKVVLSTVDINKIEAKIAELSQKK